MVHVVLFSQNKPSSDSLDECIAVVKWDTTVEVSREYRAEKLGVSSSPSKNMLCWCPLQVWGADTHDEVLRLERSSINEASPVKYQSLQVKTKQKVVGFKLKRL